MQVVLLWACGAYLLEIYIRRRFWGWCPVAQKCHLLNFTWPYLSMEIRYFRTTYHLQFFGHSLGFSLRSVTCILMILFFSFSSIGHNRFVGLVYSYIIGIGTSYWCIMLHVLDYWILVPWVIVNSQNDLPNLNWYIICIKTCQHSKIPGIRKKY